MWALEESAGAVEENQFCGKMDISLHIKRILTTITTITIITIAIKISQIVSNILKKIKNNSF